MKIPAAASATPVTASEPDRLGSIALDQWRGLALVLVLISHGFFSRTASTASGASASTFSSSFPAFWFSARCRGRARKRVGSGQKLSYWWRRLRRLYPALIAYVLAMLPLAWLLQHRPNLPPNSDFVSYPEGHAAGIHRHDKLFRKKHSVVARPFVERRL
jgi:peptidoglycan/LPS O-acetylase OafA/YrhL